VTNTTHGAGTTADTRHGVETEEHRRRNRRGEGDRLRVELLDAAADLMAEKGDIDAVSLRAVAGRVGVSPTAVYRHFDDHLSLLRAAVVHCWQEFDGALADSDDATASPFDRLRSMGDRYVRFAMEQPGKYHVLFSNKIDVELEEGSIGVSAFERLVERVTAILDERGDGRDPRFVAVEVHTWIHGIVDLIGRHTDADWPPVEALLDDLLVRLGLTGSDVSDATPPGNGNSAPGSGS
jgi:AcrR family transcriptional regulator